MKIRTLFGVTGAAVALTGCLQDSTGVDQTCTLRPEVAATVTGDTVTASNGLKYFDVKVGTGGKTSQAGLDALVYYAGYLTNGTIFDGSCDGGQALQFTAGTGELPSGGRLITGFAQGVVGMEVGGVRRIIIPPELGYGGNANGPIPANSTLVFDVELLNAQTQ